jgi:hypothetical protein
MMLIVDDDFWRRINEKVFRLKKMSLSLLKKSGFTYRIYRMANAVWHAT